MADTDLHISSSTTINQLSGVAKQLLTTKHHISANFDDLVVVFSRHKHYGNLIVELYEVSKTKSGDIKNPMKLVEPLQFVWKTDDVEVVKFFTAVAKFRNIYNEQNHFEDVEALKAIVANPLSLAVYIHDENTKATINATSIIERNISIFVPDFELSVDERGFSYEISGTLKIDEKTLPVALVAMRYGYFVDFNGTLYLVHQPNFGALINFFIQHRSSLVFDRTAYQDFYQNILLVLESKIKINYAYLKLANKKQLLEQGFDLADEKLIYISEADDFIFLTPVIRYGGVEIPIISRKQIHGKDKRGNSFVVSRNEDQEVQFIADIAKTNSLLSAQVHDFATQAHTDNFYIHKQHFLDPEWFLEAFAFWRSKGIAVLGFNTLSANKFNAFKGEVSIAVNSGVDWFETAIKLKYGKQTVKLKDLHSAIKKKSKYVKLGDGTMGILPDQWLQKFAEYFATAEVVDELLITANIDYASVEKLYEDELLSLEAKQKIKLYKQQLASFEHIAETAIPKDLQTTLRPYQHDGLNWLNFLDDLNFGGCLADDMGLGKTIQIIAFLLSQKEKRGFCTNLIVVPASLVFNCQQEVEKFAPTLKMLTLYGNNRDKGLDCLNAYDVVLTSYGTLLSDVKQLKAFAFNYVILDESQAIKNPSSQRYKAARLLQARNRLVLTGTPIENNTLDLYGQLSFACPGLLGNLTFFKNTYTIPIDQFKLRERAEELQARIKPFLLRRTKAQVAKELPDKTEMILYCEMGERQREVYDTHKKDIRDYLLGQSDDELTRSSMHVLQGITKLRQICNSPALLSGEKSYGNYSSKLDVLLEQIESKAPYHKILVFSQFVSMLNLVKQALDERKIGSSFLHGQTKNRADVVAQFQQDDNVRVFLISLKAGGVGLNLTQADYVYLIDPWWNPAVENQAIDRAYRIGQHKNVMAVRLICPNTIEEKIMLMQSAKRSLASDIIKTEASIFKALNKSDLLGLL